MAPFRPTASSSSLTCSTRSTRSRTSFYRLWRLPRRSARRAPLPHDVCHDHHTRANRICFWLLDLAVQRHAAWTHPLWPWRRKLGRCPEHARRIVVQDKELALALGINLSIARLGSVFNNELSPVIASEYNVSSALWMGVVMCSVSLLAALILIPIDKRADAAIARTKSFTSSAPVAKDQGFSCRDIRSFRPIFWLLAIACMVVYGCVIPFNNVASSLLMERDFFREPPLECQQCGQGAYAGETNCSAIAPHCPPVPPFSWPLPALSRNCSIQSPEDQLHCAHTPPYVTEAMINCDDHAWKKGPFSAVYCNRKSAAAAAAATPMSVPYLISAVLSPVMGYAVDRVGFRAGLALVSSILLTVVHLLLGTTHVTYWIPLVLQGVAYCVFAAALWPSIPYVVDARLVGSAYGAITSIQNLGLALFPMLVAMVYSVENKYLPSVEMLFVAFGALGSIAGILLNVVDFKNGSVLNRSSAAAARAVHLDADHMEALLDPNQTEL
ncbi:hypothetical protein SPRG_04275 [Saprolegnia parasitica CBS 223.65]|uniref:Lysosomal dipeptide transporter MFSD1 n=1 Tax=Saprolegnia parasitica (strain CBS 223.65) TaxID=695850 RepID=A0A067CWH7_SAPPC|nr:hypothetical protein SPRG_04275 [Saprolegnia parasitica CBS 223.65]KDO31137.1 hypothetical protein SPRG_04275 [Saprolegnia parasitica CBS 223.65]|eukprot:XP_012198265.1 hypothetical protein SPRG_04275 [Saprolegnia parasitica CBS 223.65]